MSLYAIVLAAGKGIRLNKNKPKAFYKFGTKPIYWFSLKKFIVSKKFKKIVLVLPPNHKTKIQGVKIVSGGKTRNQSFEKGMKALGKLNKNDRIFVHDGARMFTKMRDIIKLTKCKQECATLCYKHKRINFGLDLRWKNYHIQTPQYCSYKQYLKAKKNPKGRDLFSYLNLKYTKQNLITSSNKQFNFKITIPSDIKEAKFLLSKLLNNNLEYK